MERKDVETWAIRWFADNTDLSEEAVSEKFDADMFAEGFMDSLKFIFLVTSAEERFGIHFTQEDFDFTKRRFSSIGGVCALIMEHMK